MEVAHALPPVRTDIRHEPVAALRDAEAPCDIARSDQEFAGEDHVGVGEVIDGRYVLPGYEENVLGGLRAHIAERDQARKERNWARADEIRDRFTESGYTLEDTPEGTVWKRS